MSAIPISSITLTDPSGAGNHATPFRLYGDYLPANASCGAGGEIHVTVTNTITGVVEAEGDATMDGQGYYSWGCPQLTNGAKYTFTILTQIQGIFVQTTGVVIVNNPDGGDS